MFGCGCPKRLAAGTVQSLVGQSKTLFESKGGGKTYDEAKQQGNPACSLEVKKYFKAIQQEQALAKTDIKRAKPIFFDKLQKMAEPFVSQLHSTGNSLATRYILLRDKACFKELKMMKAFYLLIL